MVPDEFPGPFFRRRTGLRGLQTGLPGESLRLVVSWTLPELLGFVRSWSGVAAYREELGEDPVGLLGEELAQLWTDAEVARRVSWSLAVRAARVWTKEAPVFPAVGFP